MFRSVPCTAAPANTPSARASTATCQEPGRTCKRSAPFSNRAGRSLRKVMGTKPSGRTGRSSSSRTPPDTSRWRCVTRRVGTSSIKRRKTFTASASSARGSALAAPSHKPSSRLGKATRTPSTAKAIKPVSGGTASLGGRSRQAKRPATRCSPGARRSAGRSSRKTRDAGCPSRVTSRGQCSASPGSATHCSAPWIVQRCSNRPPSASTSMPRRPGQAQTKSSLLAASLS